MTQSEQQQQQSPTLPQQQSPQLNESPAKVEDANIGKSSETICVQRVPQLHKEKGLTFEQLVAEEENQDLGSLRSPEKVNLNVDEILPTEKQGLPSNRKFEILHQKSEQQQNIFETKKSLENAMNVLQYSRYRDKLHGNKRDLFNADKKLSSYDEVFEVLQTSFPDIKVDAQFCHLIQDILYYVNDYDAATEPKITERETLRKLKEKNLTAEELDQCQKELEVLDAIKLRSQKLNKQGLKRIEKKEINQAEENAVLAAHYFRLKKYYKHGEFDKYVRQLNLEVQNEVIDINIQGKQRVIPTIRQPIKAYDNSKFSVSKQLKYAEAVKNYLPKSGEHIAAIKARYPSFIPGIPFEKMMENYLKKMQDDFNKKDSKVLSLEERMIRFAKEFKESASKRENLVQRIEKLIENQEVRKKLEEFFKWEKEEMKARNDDEYCFQFFVKLLREGKIK